MLPTQLVALTVEMRVFLAEETVRREFLDLCEAAQLDPPSDLSLEGMVEFIGSLDELTLGHHIRKAFKAVAHKIKKVGKAVAIAGAVASAAHGGHDLTHHRPERDRHGGVTFRTAAQQSKGSMAMRHHTGTASRHV